MILIKEWKGRLGNNIMQLINVLHIALFYNCRMKLPRHPFFNVHFIMRILKTKKNALPSDEISNAKEFLLRHKINKSFKKAFTRNHKKVIQILNHAFSIKQCASLDVNDVVIHIRSGDVFEENPHPNYIVPPLSYYLTILKTNNFNQIIIVAEDDKNPVINALMNLYPNIIYKKQCLKEDIKIVLGAYSIITSYGTFIPELLCFSKKIKTIYKPSYVEFSKAYISRKVTIHNTELSDYHDTQHPWLNSDVQNRNLLLM